MVQFERGRLEHQRPFAVVVEMKGDLVRHAGDDARRHAAEYGLDGAVIMAAPQGENLAVPLEDRGELGAALEQANPVHMADAAIEWRVVHEDDGWTVRRGPQRIG